MEFRVQAMWSWFVRAWDLGSSPFVVSRVATSAALRPGVTLVPERARERVAILAQAILAQVDLPLPFGGALEGGPPGLLLFAASLLGGRPFEWGEA